MANVNREYKFDTVGGSFTSWKCPECGKKCGSHRAYKAHKKDAHEENTGKEECSECGRKYESAEKLLRHMKRVHS